MSLESRCPEQMVESKVPNTSPGAVVHCDSQDSVYGQLTPVTDDRGRNHEKNQ